MTANDYIKAILQISNNHTQIELESCSIPELINIYTGLLHLEEDLQSLELQQQEDNKQEM